MISIQCSKLESIRSNPAAYGQLLADGNAGKPGGSHGMFAYVQDMARLVHVNELTVTDAVKELHNKFIRFAPTNENKTKQANLVEQFVKYCQQFDKQNFEFIDGNRLMKWDLTPDTRLTGRTPWVVANENGYFSFILSETNFDWRSQLRFPLFQHYLVNNTIECDIREMQVGIFSMSSNSFEFKNFSDRELSLLVKDARSICTTVYTEFIKRKK
ncbi:MAG: hypothetical protein HYR66_15440 [Sphingobacteriales bacterium]|nr:hypothetical protein [Sphingobacteriales bacterium]MBI3717384.1 hypothetical protein [Sphingobacteriales bacterium]